MVNATDAGTIIDPPGLENQLNGSLGSAGIDSALFEETVLDHASGRVLNANMIDYKWRTFAELPEMTNVVLETPVDSHRFGAIGVGEVATAPGPSAVLMAASNALGMWMDEYPLTPERVLRALGKAGPRVRGGDAHGRLHHRHRPPRRRGGAMRSFRHLRAGSVEEACALLAEHGARARANAGGTDLLGAPQGRHLSGAARPGRGPQVASRA